MPDDGNDDPSDLSKLTLDQLVTNYDFYAENLHENPHYYDFMVEIGQEVERRLDHKMPS